MVKQKIRTVLEMQIRELLKTWNKDEILEVLDGENQGVDMMKVKEFTYKGRKCVIIKMMPERGDMDVSSLIPSEWHNGYVEVYPHEKEEDYNDYNVSSEEITFGGSLDGIKGIFMGFDTLHLGDNSGTRNAEAVEQRIKKLVDELEVKE